MQLRVRLKFTTKYFEALDQSEEKILRLTDQKMLQSINPET